MGSRGLGVRLIDEPGRRHAGSYGWDGGLGSSWWTDPVAGVTAILLTNQMWTSPQPPTAVTEFWSAAFGESELALMSELSVSRTSCPRR